MNFHLISQVKKDSIVKVNYIKEIVYTLADDSMNGRGVSTIYELKAAQYIYSKIKKEKGLKPKYHQFIYQKTDTSIALSSQNVYCFLNNKADSTILIGAHYDHIAPGSYLSLAYSKKNQIHNGADDNASGVALLLSLIKQRKNWYDKSYNYVFVFYSAHEIGLFGSKAFYTYAKSNLPPIKTVLNFDLVGRLDLAYLPQITFYGSGTISEAMRNEIKTLQNNIKFDLDKSDNIKYSDCLPYLKDNIPCLWITSGAHNDYHKPEDDAKFIKFDGIYAIQNILEKQILKTTLFKKN